MALDADWVVDRRRLKRHLTAWRMIALAALVAGAVSFLGPWQPLGGLVGKDHVARLDVTGLILHDPDLIEALDDIAEAPHAKALIVRINSSGGTVVAGEALYRALRRVAGHKPVVAVMDDLATSAAYMTAIGADRIYASPGTVTGSIGVILQSADVTGLLEKLGVRPENVKSGPLKAQPNPLEPFTPEARAAIAQVVDDFHAFFIDLVAERRGFDRPAAVRLGDGRVFSGRQAVEKGLIDAIGDERAARRWLAEERGVAANLPVMDVDLAREGGPFVDWFERTVGKALFSEPLRLDGLISVWHPSLR
jgi:protease-4